MPLDIKTKQAPSSTPRRPWTDGGEKDKAEKESQDTTLAKDEDRPAKAEEEAGEWAERQRLSTLLREVLGSAEPGSQDRVRRLLDPYWGFDALQPVPALRDLLLDRRRSAPAA